jgi:hypothetical protein
MELAQRIPRKIRPAEKDACLVGQAGQNPLS